MELIVASVVGFSTAAFALGIFNLILFRDHLRSMHKYHLESHKEKEALLDALWLSRHTHGKS